MKDHPGKISVAQTERAHGTSRSIKKKGGGGDGAGAVKCSEQAVPILWEGRASSEV